MLILRGYNIGRPVLSYRIVSHKSMPFRKTKKNNAYFYCVRCSVLFAYFATLKRDKLTRIKSIAHLEWLQPTATSHSLRYNSQAAF